MSDAIPHPQAGVTSPPAEPPEHTDYTDHTKERLDAHLAEYDALRKEIEWLIQMGNQYFNFGLILLGAIATALPFILEKEPALILPTLLTIPFFFSLLGFLFLHEHEEVFIVAAYLRDEVRTKIRALLADDAIWTWEEYKQRRSAQVFGNGPFGLFGPNKVANLLRSSLFLVPSLLALGGALAISKGGGGFPFFHTQNATEDVLLSVWLILDLLITLLLVIKLLTRGNLSQRVFGTLSPSREPRAQNTGAAPPGMPA